MNFTYRNNLWKGQSSNTIIPSNSRPFTNNDTKLKTTNRVSFKPNPIKQWRKQLLPNYKTSSSKQVSIENIEAPSTSVFIGHDNNNCNTNNSKVLKENINVENKCDGLKCVNGKKSNLKRSANTNINSNYHVNYKSYLKSKCKTYSQNTTLGKKTTQNTFESSSCQSSQCNKPVIYKPSNSSFSNQGSVSASSYLLRKKQNALNKNNHNLKQTYGNKYIKNVTYNPNLPSFCKKI